MRLKIILCIIIVLNLLNISAAEDSYIFPRTGHWGSIAGFSFSPDGKRFISTGFDGRSLLWDAENGNLIRDINEFSTGNYINTFSSDGKFIYMVSSQDGITVVDAKTGEILKGIFQEKFEANHEDISLDGKYVAKSNTYNEIIIWSIAEDKQVLRFNIDETKARFQTKDIKLGPKGRFLFVAFEDGDMMVYDINKQIIVNHFNSPIKIKYPMTFFPDGKKFAISFPDSTIKIWDIGKQQPVKEYKCESRGYFKIAVSPNQRYLAYSKQAEIKIIDLKNNSIYCEFEVTDPGRYDSHNEITALAFDPNSKLLLSGHSDGYIREWDLNKKEKLLQLQNNDKGLYIYRITDNYIEIKSFLDRGLLFFWSRKNYDLTVSRSENEEYRKPVIISPDNKYLISGFRHIPFRNHKNPGSKLYSEDFWERIDNHPGYAGKSLYDSSKEGVKVWNLYRETVVCELDKKIRGDDFTITVWSPDSKSIFSGTIWKKIREWDPRTGKLIHDYKGHKSTITALDIHPSGKYMFSASADRSIMIWDLKKKIAIKRRSLPLYPIMDAIYTPSGEEIVTMSGGNVFRIYDTETMTPKCNLAIFPDNEWIVYFDGSEKYMASRNGRKYAMKKIEDSLLPQSVKIADEQDIREYLADIFND